jgi:hypothetical protein
MASAEKHEIVRPIKEFAVSKHEEAMPVYIIADPA